MRQRHVEASNTSLGAAAEHSVRESRFQRVELGLLLSGAVLSASQVDELVGDEAVAQQHGHVPIAKGEDENEVLEQAATVRPHQ